MTFRGDEKEKAYERAGEQRYLKTGTFFIHPFFYARSKDDYPLVQTIQRMSN